MSSEYSARHWYPFSEDKKVDYTTAKPWFFRHHRTSTGASSDQILVWNLSRNHRFFSVSCGSVVCYSETCSCMERAIALGGGLGSSRTWDGIGDGILRKKLSFPTKKYWFHRSDVRWVHWWCTHTSIQRKIILISIAVTALSEFQYLPFCSV